MKQSPDYYKGLFDRLLEGKLSPDETEELTNWLGAEVPDADAVSLVDNVLQHTTGQEKADHETAARLKAKLPFIIQAGSGKTEKPVVRRLWLRYAAAVLVIVSASLLYFLTLRQPTASPVAAVKAQVSANDVLPGQAGAILTLADGSTVVLDSMGNGLVARQSGSKVLLQNGELQYRDDGSHSGEIVYNMIATPHGRQFQMTLPDGTKVWLNAGSSLRFPTVFSSRARRVEITGEGYFEVAKDAAKPFTVSINNSTDIEVLGTHFNVNSYNNESSIRTTLLEGSVKITSGAAGKQSEVKIAPGQQAQLQSGRFKVENSIDVAQVMAWKNGIFNFHNATLEEVMRQLERWYDIEVVYEKGVPDIEFVGKMGRDLSLTKVLRGLEMSEVHFRLLGRKLIVMP